MKPRHATPGSFKPGHRLPPEAIEKQRRAIKARIERGEKWGFRGRPEAIERGLQTLKARLNREPVKCVLCGELFVRNNARQRYCRECVPSKAWLQRAIKYGLGKPQWEAQLRLQNGFCALCTKKPTCIDHDHLTGRVRGLLCNSCNILVAALDRPGWLEGALKYVRGGDE